MKTKKQIGGAFLVLFIISMGVQLLINNEEQFFDATAYWRLGREFGWNVRNLSSGFRGWLLPCIFSLCSKVGMHFDREFLGYWIMASFAFSFTFTFSFFMLARMLEFKEDSKYIIGAGGVCGIVFFVFFRGLLIYTLSDFYAFSLSLLAVILVYSVLEYEQKWYMKVLEAFVLGLSLYGTYNIRTIYLFLAIASIGLLTIWQIFRKKWAQMLVTLPACLGGMLVCALPQMILNHKLFGEYSWKVPTEGLMLFQLHCGVSTGRYATYVGDPGQYGSAGMYFADNIGHAILDRAQLTEFTSYGQVFRLFLQHPLDFAGIYMRHLLNMLYPFYPNQYIQDVTGGQKLAFIGVLYYIVHSSFLFCIFGKAEKQEMDMAFADSGAVCLHSSRSGGNQVFIALHFVIYMYAILGAKVFIAQCRAHKIRFIVSYLTGFLLYVAYAGMLLATTEAGVAIINY